MHDSAHPERPARSRRAHLLGVALLLSGVFVAGYGGSPGSAAATGPVGHASFGVVSDCLLLPPAQGACYAPRQFRVAYGVQPLLDSGIDGHGETVTVLAPAPSASAQAGPPPGSSLPPSVTDIRQDLEGFDGEFRLPAARIQVVTSLAGAASPWRATPEEVGDTEMLHAVAPAAALRVVLLPSDVLASAAAATADMLAALRLAVSHTDVASISWSLGEHYFTTPQVAEMHSILLEAAARHVTVIDSSGDQGALSDTRFGSNPVEEVSLPASDPLVLGVGGTTLTADHSTGAYIGETAWDQGPVGSGGGFSHLYPRPAYQDGVAGTSTARGVPDVAGDADAGISFVFADGGKTYIIPLFGTSASAPLWGGLVALADQYAHHDLGSVNPGIYRIARSSSYRKAFHDITVGDNSVTDGSVAVTGYQAAPGWDPVTGWGSPNAQALIPGLARDPDRGGPSRW